MNRAEFATLFQQEENFWWFRGQRFLLWKILRQIQPETSAAGFSSLDVGCGTGLNLKLLQRFGPAEGIDLSPQAVEFCAKRGFKIKRGDVASLPYPENRFDLITAMGVFYHREVKDDLQGMKEVFRVLKPGGWFIIFDPAMKCLFSNHDLAFQGARRYSRKELLTKLRKAGFQVEQISYLNITIFPFLFLKRKLERLFGSKPCSEVQEINPLFNFILKKIYLAEIRLLRYFNYPFGVNIFAVGKKG